MIWRLWCFVAGLAPGALGALAFVHEPSLFAVEIGAAAGGVALALAASLVARVRDDDPARGPHLAAASSVGLAALPACGAALLGLAPDPRVWLVAVVAALAAAFFVASRVRGPAPAREQLGTALGGLAAGAVLVVGAGAAVAAVGAEESGFVETRAAAIYDLDALVATLPLPACRPRLAAHRVLLDRGAHPRLDADGAHVWFDAEGPDGRRQVHRLSRATGEVVCWTCAEPGHNARPSVGAGGASVVFETDRHATWRDPANTELHLASARGEEAPRAASRRLTFTPGADDHAVLHPNAPVIVWSHAEGGRVFVGSASLRSGHGGLFLGRPAPLHAGGAAWAAPLGWSPDARSLVVVRGNPYRPLEAVSLDLARGTATPLSDDAPGHAPASFNGDGARAALGRSERLRAAGLAPRWLGFVLGPFATRSERDAALFRGTGLALGDPDARLDAVELGPLATWGAPTGVALAPDGTALVLGQRRPGGDGAEERLVEVALDCDGAGGSEEAAVASGAAEEPAVASREADEDAGAGSR